MAVTTTHLSWALHATATIVRTARELARRGEATHWDEPERPWRVLLIEGCEKSLRGLLGSGGKDEWR